MKAQTIAHLSVEIPMQESTGSGAGLREVWRRVPARFARNGDVLIETNRGWSRPTNYRGMICDAKKAPFSTMTERSPLNFSTYPLWRFVVEPVIAPVPLGLNRECGRVNFPNSKK